MSGVKEVNLPWGSRKGEALMLNLKRGKSTDVQIKSPT